MKQARRVNESRKRQNETEREKETTGGGGRKGDRQTEVKGDMSSVKGWWVDGEAREARSGGLMEREGWGWAGMNRRLTVGLSLMPLRRAHCRVPCVWLLLTCLAKLKAYLLYVTHGNDSRLSKLQSIKSHISLYRLKKKCKFHCVHEKCIQCRLRY